MSDEKEKLKALAKTTQRELVQFRRLSGPGWLGGVCAAIGYRLGIPPWIVRLIWGGLILCKGVGLVLYLILWVLVPKAETPSDYAARTGDGE